MVQRQSFKRPSGNISRKLEWGMKEVVEVGSRTVYNTLAAALALLKDEALLKKTTLKHWA